MTDRVVAQKAPYPVTVEEGKTYWWCACGKSAKQPFCDGAHKGSGINPVAWVSDKTGTAYLCGCKATKNEPLCDGAHKAL